jgi:sodium-coupled neutral amino acid transporter 11
MAGGDGHGPGGRLVNASIGSSVINLANTIIGAGMLGLPYAFAQSGYIFGLFLLV